MKVTIGMYEVDVKVKKNYHEQNNIQYTLYFLNELCIIYREASTFNACQGYQGIAKDYNEKAKEIYEQLETAGCYEPDND